MVRLDQVCRTAGRPAGALTRRDVVLALLTEPAAEVLTGLPALRRELVAAGNPLSIPFWESAEAVLTSIRQGTATRGEVQSWLGATGTEPLDILEQVYLAGAGGCRPGRS